MKTEEYHLERINRIQIELEYKHFLERLLREWGVLGNVGKYYDDLIKEARDNYKRLDKEK